MPKIEREAFTEFLPAEDANCGDAPFCEVCGLCLGSLPWLPPFRAEIHTWGKVYGDFAYGPNSSEVLVSSRFKKIYDECGLHGLSGFEPIELLKLRRHRKIAGEMPQYLVATVARSQTAIDPIASGVEWQDEPVCDRCLIGRKLKRRRRIVVDEKTWTGEDIFFLRGLPGEFITTHRFKEICEANHVANAVLVPAIHRR